MSRVGSRRGRGEADDEDLDGGSVVSMVGARSSVSSKKPRPTLTKKRSSLDLGYDDLDGGDEGEEQHDGEKCYLCNNVIGAREEKKRFNGLVFDKRCHAAVRCCRRQLNGVELRSFDANMLDDPENFREMCCPFKRPEGGTRDPRVRKKPKQFQVRENHKITDDVDQKLLLNRNRFYRHHKRWDGWGKAKCDAVFDEKMEEQLGL